MRLLLSAPVMGHVRATLDTFVTWLDAHGETSFDHQSFFAGRGGMAKALYYRNRALGVLAVAPIIACEAFLPEARRLFWKRQRLPIADAHYASAFAFLAGVVDREANYQRAVHFLRVLVETRCPSYSQYAWGYPFDWVTVRGTIVAGTPLITTVPYVYEAFEQVYRLDSDPKWFEIMRSVAEHVLTDYTEHPVSAISAHSSYTPNRDDRGGVVNASAYRAFVLMKAASDFNDARYREAAQRNLNFVLQSQNADGSWNYAMDQQLGFVDHFHTCFVLKSLAKIEALTGNPQCGEAIARGVSYYVHNLFDSERLPKPFSRRPRLTVYRRELYDYAECINLAVLLNGRFPELDANVAAAVEDLQHRWKKRDGSFRTRQLLLGWDNVPMHRWAQSQMFRSLAFLLHESGTS